MYGYDVNPMYGWAIFEIGSVADPDGNKDGGPEDEGGIVGTSEWIWLKEEQARRIVAALNFVSGISTEKLEAALTLHGEGDKCN